MKKLILLLFLVATTLAVAGVPIKKPVYNRLTKQWATYPVVTIRQIQEVPMSYLLKADTLQNTVPTADTLQYSPYNEDTVTVVALCTVPWDWYRFTAEGMTMELYDTIPNPYPWGGIFVRATTNIPQHELDGFKNVEIGDVIEMTGVVTEFPLGSMNSVTQFQPIPGIPITAVGSKPVPPIPFVSTSAFYQGQVPGGSIRYSTGEPYEGLFVELHNLVVTSILNSFRGTFNLNDTSNNSISDYDASRWYTIRPPDPNTGYVYRDPLSTYTLPPQGTVMDTMRAMVTVVSGTENNRGYRMCPTFPGDLVIGNIMPTLSTHRRYPVVVTGTDSPQVTARGIMGTYAISSVKLYYRVNYGAYTPLTMTLDNADTLYKVRIPTQSAGVFVNYFLKIQDANGNTRILASAHPQLSTDTSKGTFFYTVGNGQLSIYDVQYTPFSNGYSPYIGAQVGLTGTVTADSVVFNKAPLSGFGTNTWYIQTGKNPWNGIWVDAADSLMHGILLGDSIYVRGTVGEGTSNLSIVTDLYNIDSVAIITSGRPVPVPIDKPTGDFAWPSISNGSPSAEPYEGMLVRLHNLTVTNIWPYFADPTEYEVNDGSGGMIVRRDGANSYSNLPGDTASGKYIIKVGEHIDTLVGIIYSSAQFWKIDPRSDADFLLGPRYPLNNKWNLVSIPRKIKSYLKNSVYPTRTAGTDIFIYNNGYFAKDTLDNGPGYWGKFTGAQTVRYNGVIISTDTIPVIPGWNLIGSITDSVLTSNVVENPTGNVKSLYFGYNNGYTARTSLQGGQGHWVKCDSAGVLILNGTNYFNSPKRDEMQPLRQMNSITIKDAAENVQTLYFGTSDEGKIDINRFEMPPMPPAGAFDARFASSRFVETYPTSLIAEQNYPVRLSAPVYPITVTWNITEQDPNKGFFLLDGADGKNTKTVQMQGSASMTIKSAKEDVLTLKVGRNELPREFSLSQNYPNPFNPTTKFTVGVPVDAQLEVVVYDILGRKVRTLVDEQKSAGYHVIEWNGLADGNTSVGTGVYFVRMASGKFNAVRKIMMMK